MKLIIQKDRKAIPVGAYGTQNENEVTELTLKIPEEYQNWNKRIVFLTSEGNFWDYIQDDTYTIKNNITKFTSVRAYIWLTNDEQDFRTKEFILSFWDNRNADNLIPTAEQIDGFNTLITTLNLEITTVTDLETELNGIITDLQYKLDTGYFKGEKGQDGENGTDGHDGVDGQDGKSAYQIWLDEGNVGTEEDFLESLKGEKGQDGENGDCNFATFDIEDGDLIMNKDDDMNIDFVINQGNLVVII